ncbi:MAG: methyltransferase domain-containing protein [bacterium]|nr:methyltransferase domain-containing protein [bacterium]
MDQRSIAHHLVPVVHEDEDYLFVNKPAGLDSQARERARGPAVVDLLADRDDAGSLLPLYDVNRWQSGVLGFAKSVEAQAHLLTGLETGSAQSVYSGVVEGRVKRRVQIITGSIFQVAQDRFAMDRKASGPRLPSTRVKSEEHGDRFSLVRCQPEVLNHHQVRAHLESVGLHIVGDVAYRARRADAKAGPMMLHLAELRFHHPRLKRSISIRASTPREFRSALGNQERKDAKGTRDTKETLEGLMETRLRAALVGRVRELRDEETSAFRVLNGRADLVPGLVAELYNDVLVLQAHQGKFDAVATPLAAVAQWYTRELGVAAVYVKLFAKDRSRGAADSEALHSPRPLVGDPAPEQFSIREAGLDYWVRAYDGYAVGLYLDHRENRRRVREMAAGRDVLNLFSYTCGFSIAAAAGEARSTVSVDISRKSLEWGKQNFQVNGFALDDHVFINDDAFNYFKRARRQERSFDLIVIDPPSFARAKAGRRVFNVENDLESLLAGAIGLLNRGGMLLVSTNWRGATRKWLREQIIAAAGSRKVTKMSTPQLPQDFTGDRDHAKTIIARFP